MWMIIVIKYSYYFGLWFDFIYRSMLQFCEECWVFRDSWKMDNLHDFPLNFGINRDYLTSLYGSQNIVSRTIPITLNIDT